MSNTPTLLTLIANEVRRIKAIVEPASNASALIEPLSFLSGTLNLLTDKISELQNAYDSNARELQALAVSFDGMEKERDKFAKEIEGLKSDVRSAEAAYEIERLRANDLALEQDRWKNEYLPGWRKRVSEAECKLLEQVTRAKFWEDRYYSVAGSEPEQAFNTAPKDTEICQHSEGNKLGCPECGEQFLNDGEGMCEGIDRGAPEGDKTVVSWKCACGTQHQFKPPRFSYWSYSSECSTCGSKISLSPLSV